MTDLNIKLMEKVEKANPITEDRDALYAEYKTHSAVIRFLASKGYERKHIAKFLGKRYQHVRNVLVQGPPKRDQHSKAAGGKNSLVNKHLGRGGLRIQIGNAGRIVIPVEIRKAMGVDDGDTLSARVEDGVLVLMSPDTAIRKAQELVRRYIPEDVSLVDELIAERRAEAVRETGQ